MYTHLVKLCQAANLISRGHTEHNTFRDLSQTIFCTNIIITYILMYTQSGTEQ